MNLIRCDRTYAEPILAILNEVIVHSTALYDYHPRPVASMDAWFEAKERAEYPVIGAIDDDGTLAGFATYGPFRNWPAYKYTVELSIHLAPPYRGRGIGSRLLPALIEAAREQQYHVMIGGIDADNAASIALHKKFGFTECAHVRHAGYKFGRWLDLALYQFVLDTPDQPVEG